MIKNSQLTFNSPDEEKEFQRLLDENRYDFVALAYLIFGFGEAGTEMEDIHPYDWQVKEWIKFSKHLQNPLTRYDTYRLIISSGNGAAKTSFGAMTVLILMYTQQVRGRITANTQPQMKSVVWPEYDIWCQRAKYFNVFFEKLGESIKAKDPVLGETWRIDAVTWSENSPASISGLHNKGKAIVYGFEEAPGIPHIIWKYVSGAMTDVDTIKLWFAMGNSDDPESAFEQNMSSPDWHSLRIDTRTMAHVDKKQIEVWLRECNYNEDHDDFRVRVRGLPRKSAKDSIISIESVQAALDRRIDLESISSLPVILTCDPAWDGGDETVIGYRQGHYFKLLERYTLNKARNEDHMITFTKLCEWYYKLKADVVFIDQAEGTAIKTLANAEGRTNWHLISFASSPWDTADTKDSQFANLRAQMYYAARDWLLEGAILDCEVEEDREMFAKQICWTKGTRHSKTLKKLAEEKKEIKSRVGRSPDLADCFVLSFARPVFERLPENQTDAYRNHEVDNQMPMYDPYADMDKM